MKNIRRCAVGIVCLLLPVLFGSCKKKVVDVDVEEMRSICNLAVMECYYHNIAKVSQTGGFSVLKWDVNLTNDKILWMDYTAKIKVGVDANKIDVKTEGNTVKIRLPKPDILQEPNIVEDFMNFFSSEGGKSKIAADKRLEAVRLANDNMVNVLKENTTIMHNAEKRVKEILTSYVMQIGKLSGVEYEIKFESTEESIKGE